MLPDDSRTLPRRLAAARRSFCRHIRSALQAQACVLRFSGEAPGRRTAFSCDGIAAAEARRLGAHLDEEFIGRLGFAHGLSGTFHAAGGELCIVVLRTIDEPAFTAADRRTLDSIGALAESILELASIATDLSALLQTSMQVLDRLTVGIVLVDPKGGVLASNRTARDIARKHDEPAEAQPFGPAPHRLLHTLSQSARRSDGHTLDAAAFASQDAGESSRISVLATPLVRTNGDGPRPQAAIALFLSDTGRLFAPYQDWLRRLYGLTRLEAQLVTQIVEGRNLNDIAASLHVSIHTVRSYLKQIFGKTGVHRQASLVKLVVGGIGQVRADHDQNRHPPFSH